MKKTAIIILCFGLLLPVLNGFAQQTKRHPRIGSDKYRSLLENYKHVGDAPQGNRDGGVVYFFENFDNMTGGLPEDWIVGGNSETCMWGVDDSPNPPGYYSASYSLNYNNGVNYDCGNNFGSVETPPITVNGEAFTVSFMYLIDNECGQSPCGEGSDWIFDNAWLLVVDMSDNVIFDTGIEGTTTWNLNSYNIPNDQQLDQVKLVFYFDTGDEILNEYAGPFVDDLSVTGTTEVPVSNWALVIGFVLIGTFIAFRFMRRK